MITKKLKALAMAVTAVMAFSAVPVTAADSVDLSKADSQIDVRVNKPYLNFTVSAGDGVDISKMDFTLKDSKGNAVATFKGGNTKFSTVGEHMFDFSSYHSAADLTWFPGNYERYADAYDLFYPDPVKGTSPSGRLESLQGGGALSGDGVYLTFTRDYYYNYTDKSKLQIVDTKTVPANTLMVDVSSKFVDSNNKRAYFWLEPISSEDLVSDYPQGKDYVIYDHAGKIESFNAQPGTYHVRVNGGRAGGNTCRAYDHATTYFKVRIKFTEAFPGLANDDLIIDKDFFGKTFRFDLRGDNSVNTFSGIYYSGAMISAPIPDANGYVEFWVSDDTLTAYMEYDYRCPGGAGGGSVMNARFPKSIEKINNIFEYPQTGFCLYNIPADKYTLVIDDPVDSRDYKINSPTVNVTSVKTMQKAAFTVEKKPLLLGDCNRDGVIDLADVMLVAGQVKGIHKLDGRGPVTTDVNEDGKIDLKDISVIAAHVKGIKKIPRKLV